MRITSCFLFLLLSCSIQAADDFRLQLGGLSFDPVVEQPLLPVSWRGLAAPAGDLHLIQFEGVVQADWVENLAAQGITPIQYIHPHTYIVWASEDRLTSLSATDHIRWHGYFQPGYRVLPVFRDRNEHRLDVAILVFRGAHTDSVMADLQALGARDMQARVLDHRFSMITANMISNRFAAAAKIPGLYSLQVRSGDPPRRGEMSCQLNANQLSGDTILTGYPDWLASVGFDGDGVIVASVDEGFNQNHPDLVNRVMPCVGATCEDRDATHGNHVAALVAADAASGTRGSQGFLRGLGVAPGAGLLEQVYLDYYTRAGGLALLMHDSQNNGAVISSNSWGTSRNAEGYDMDTMQVDIGVRDANGDLPGNQQFNYVLAIDNGQGGTSTQGAPEEAKNVFRVGASYIRNLDGSQRTDYNSLAQVTAHGPARDGRFLPDIVAPGQFVDSAALNDGYVFLSGTSMAAPQVAGAAALFFEMYRQLPQNPGSLDPSPALVKAALMAPAHDLGGNNDADGVVLGHRFDSKQGWGRLDLEAVIDPAVSVVYVDAPMIFGQNGESWTLDLMVDDNSKPVQVMLAYTDAPGHGLGGVTPAWNNNLNLEVDYNGETFKGNVLGADGWSETGGSADPANNVEGVLIGPTAPTNDLTVRVNAAGINSDGVPNSGDATDQDFALVCYNCAQDPSFLLQTAELTDYTCAPNDGSFVINVGQINGFSETVTLSVSGLPVDLGAAFDVNPVTLPGSSTLTITNTGAVAAGDYAFQVVGNAGGQEKTLDVVLRIDTGIAAGTTLNTPQNGSIDQSLSPLLRWTAQNGVTRYDVQLSDDAGFANLLLDDSTAETELQYSGTLIYATTYFWRVRGFNACGDGNWSSTFSFTTVDPPPVLVVDDDNNLPNVLSYYTGALDYWGVGYDIWDVSVELGEPSAEIMAPYPMVLWFSGDAFDLVNPQAGPSSAGEAALASYLDGGGCLVLSSQYYLTQMGGNPFTPTSFMTNYLGLGSAIPNAAQLEIMGAGTGFDHLGPYNLSPPAYTNRSDVVSPGGSARLIFTGNEGDAGIMHDSGTYKALFMGFSLDGISEKGRLEVMPVLLASCGVSVKACINIDVLYSKLAFWPENENIPSLVQCVNQFAN